ncbi:MAG TPA: hypothetical protein VGK73_10710 [Polyangiaceae bacterium]
MGSPLATVTLASAFVLLLCGCRSKAAPAPAASATITSARVPSTARPSAVASSKPRAPAGCRVIGVRGAAQAKESAAFDGRFFGGPDWVDVPADLELSLRHTETSREFELHGPGRFRPCAAGAEAVLVARGKVETSTGSGVRAGAEVLLGTPFAAVHYSEAKLTLEVADRKLSLRVESGSAVVERTGGEVPKGVSGPNGKLDLSGTAAPGELVRACVEARAATESPLPSPSVQRPNLGAWAVIQLKARRSERFACAQAEAAVGRLAGAEQSRLSGLLDGAETPARPTGSAGK